VPDVVRIEYLGRQRVTAPVADTSLCVNLDVCHGDAAGNVSGSDSTERRAAVNVNSVPGVIS
jgi:hypothetical protein